MKVNQHLYFKEPLLSWKGAPVLSQAVVKISPALLILAVFLFLPTEVHPQHQQISEKDNRFDWIQTARVFLIDAYQPPFAPELEYDAEALAEVMTRMNVNVVRFPNMGKYATIQDVRFSLHPDQGDRDLLQETIDACKRETAKTQI